MTTEADFDEQIAEVKAALDARRYTDAVDCATRFLNTNPPSFERYFHRAQAKALLNDQAGAIDDITAALTLNPREPALYFFRGIWRIDQRDYVHGASDLERVSK
jgi:hypothetical protein